MTVDRSKLQLYSEDPIDKIVYETTGTITSSASSENSTTVTHNYGKKVYPFVYGQITSGEYITGGIPLMITPGAGGDLISTLEVVNSTNSATVYFFNRDSSSETINFVFMLLELES